MKKESNIVIRDYEKYIKSEKWKCSQSPIGSHHWIVSNPKQTMTCKYCNKSIKVDNRSVYQVMSDNRRKNANSNKGL